MNFFGHAVVAGWKRRGAAFALGAMLPDFAAMARARLLVAGHPELSAGLDWHHATDRAFHMDPTFRRLMRAASQRLSERGMARGPALGAGHVAVELLLDGYLVRDEPARQKFTAALREGAPERLGGVLAWESSDEAERWQLLRRRLELDGALGYTDLGEIGLRTARALGRRPLLAMSNTDQDLLAGELPDLRSEVEEAAPVLLAGLRRELGLP